MRLDSLDGLFVDLSVTGYEFPNVQASADQDWDANWLMVRGKVWDGTASWEFTDPCMTTWEASELANWLRRAGQRRVLSHRTQPRLWFTEPNLSFELVTASHEIVTLDVLFDAEAKPPHAPDGEEHQVRLQIAHADLGAAVQVWLDELHAFPAR